MNFSPYQAQGRLAAPNQNYTDPLRVSYNNAGAQALARENGKLGMTFWGGALAYKEQVDSAKSLEANNEYNRLMSEGTAELMQRKQEKALNIVEDYDKLQSRTLEQIKKKYGNYINYGKAAVEFNNYTTRDNATRRSNMLKYQLAETDAFHETQFNNQIAACNQMVLDGGGTDEAIEGAYNRMAGLVSDRYANYGQEKIKEQARIMKGGLVSSALGLAMNMQDYAKMGHLANKYADCLDPKTRIAVLSMFGKRQKEAHELRESNEAFVMLGENATFDDYKNFFSNQYKGYTDDAKLYAHCNTLLGEEMPNGRNGCVEAFLKLTAPFFKFAADNKDEVNVGRVCQLAENADGVTIERYHGGNIPEGAGIIYFSEGDDLDYANAEHITMSDGNGGFYGNSSSARDYQDEEGNTVRGNGCVIHSDDQEIGGYKIGYVIRMDKQTMQEMADLEIEEKAEKAWRRHQQRLGEVRAAQNRLIEQGGLDMQDLFNHDVKDESQYNAIVEKYWAQSGYDDKVRIKLETDMNNRLKAIRKADEAEAKRAAGGGSGSGSGGGSGKKNNDPMIEHKLTAMFYGGATKEEMQEVILDGNYTDAKSLINYIDGLFGDKGKSLDKYKDYKGTFYDASGIHPKRVKNEDGEWEEADPTASLAFADAADAVLEWETAYRREHGYDPTRQEIQNKFEEMAVRVPSDIVSALDGQETEEKGFFAGLYDKYFGSAEDVAQGMTQAELHDLGVYNIPYKDERTGNYVVELQNAIIEVTPEQLKRILIDKERVERVIK